MKLHTKLLGLAGALALLGSGNAHAQGLQFYTALTGSEAIADQLNPTGASFTSGLVHATSQGVNAQTGTSYTVLGTTGIPQTGIAPVGDMGKLVTFSNAGQVAIALPAAGTAGFEANKWFCVENTSAAGTDTITPTTSTINGAATLVIYPSRGACVWSDGTNYQIVAGGVGLVGTPLTVAEGGTGDSTLTNHGVLVGSGISPVSVTAVGGTGTILVGSGASADPIFTGTPAGLTSIEAITVNAGASGTAGTLAVFPTTASTGKTTFTASANSGATTTNINTAAQTGARTYTVPDAGGNATFQLTGGSVSATGLIVTPLMMANMKTVAGLQMTGSASSTNFGLVYTPATGTYLIGTATSSGSTSNVAAYDFVLPPSYIAGTNITVEAACYYLNGSSTASVHTMAAAAYLNNVTAGTQGSTLIGTGAQTCPITTAAQQTFTITGTSLVPGSYLTLTFSAAVTNAGGASTEYLTGVTLN